MKDGFRPGKVHLGLVLLLALQLLLFWSYTSEFFTADGIFYLARPLETWSDLREIFSRLDDRDNYRPLTYVVSTLLYWWADVDPFPHHLVVLLGHGVITLLVFGLARVILQSDLGALVTAFFFGLHSAASHVTFDLSFLPDHIYGALYVLALIAFVKSRRQESPGWYCASLGFFFLALLSKEPAVTFPAVALLVIMLVPGLVPRDESKPVWRRAFFLTIPFWLLTALYLIYFGALSNGRFIPTDPDHPYHLSLSLDSLLSKERYLEWAFNFRAKYGTLGDHPTVSGIADRILPATAASIFSQSSDIFLYLIGPIWVFWLAIRGKWDYVSDFGINAFWTPVIALSLAVLVKHLFRCRRDKDKTAWFGLLFFLVVLSPALLLPRDKTMPHNLYVPVIGLGLTLGHLATVSLRGASSAGTKLVAVCVPAVFVVGGVYNSFLNTTEAWPVTSAWQTRNYLEDVQRLYPKLSPDTILFFEKTGRRDWPWFTDAGNLYRVYYKNPNLVTLFGDYDQVIPDSGESGRTIIRFHESDDHLFLVEMRGGKSDSQWIDLFEPETGQFSVQGRLFRDRDGYYIRREELTFRLRPERTAYTIVLPHDFWPTFCSYPAQISQEVDGRVSLRISGDSSEQQELLLRARRSK